jgi:hypothetical protein
MRRLGHCFCALVIILAFGTCVPSVKSQAKQPKTASAATARQRDRRYAVVSGAWSAATVSLFNTWTALDDNPQRRAHFYSPDHKKRIEILGERVFLRIDGRTFDTGVSSVLNHDAELGWAPDSTKFFVTWSETGELGTWHMQVFGADASGVHEFRGVEEPARKDFERLVRKLPIDPILNTPELRELWKSDDYCEPYNVIGGRWLNGSRKILLSVLISNTSDCRYMSLFDVYRVDATTGRILQRYTAAEGHKLFGNKYLPRITR